MIPARLALGWMLVILLLALLLTGCSGSQTYTWEWFRRPEPPPLAVERPRPVIATEVLTAEVRRAQVIQDIVALTWLTRHTARQERLVALEIALADRRAELARLDAVIGR